MAEQLASASPPREGVVFIGRAQEKTTLFRTEKRRNPDGASYPWIVKSTGVVNHFYFYCVDADFGPFFLKFCSYFPYNAKLCLNGHHWAQRQAGEGRDRVHRDGQRVRRGRRRRRPASDLRRARARRRSRRCWTSGWPILPNPFTDADRAAGYRYDISILQAEFSLTQMLDAPVTGRVFFEQVIRDNLDIGRADKVGLIFDRRDPPRTQAAHAGPVPHPGDHRRRHPEPARRLQAHHDQAVPQGRESAYEPRPPSTTAGTSDIGKRLVNLPALREIGFSANRRLLGVQRLDHDPITGTQRAAHRHRPGHHPHRHRGSPGCASDSNAATPCCPRC